MMTNTAATSTPRRRPVMKRERPRRPPLHPASPAEARDEPPADGMLQATYDCGILHSIIVHTLLLLALALMVVDREVAAPIRIRLDFAADGPVPLEAALPEIVAEAEAARDDDLSGRAAQVPEDIPLDAPLELAVVLEDVAAVAAGDATALQDGRLAPALFQELPAEFPPASASEPIDPPAADRASQMAEAVRSRFRARPRSEPVAAAGPPRPAGVLPHGFAMGAAGDGIGGDVGMRLKHAGAQTGAIQISLAWDTIDDIDLHVSVAALDGRSSHICWMSRMGLNGGMLDVDMNAGGPLTNRPVENVYWPFGQAPQGRITVGVHHFRNRSGGGVVPVTVVVKVGDQPPQEFRTQSVFGAPPQPVHTFQTGP